MSVTWFISYFVAVNCQAFIGRFRSAVTTVPNASAGARSLKPQRRARPPRADTGRASTRPAAQAAFGGDISLCHGLG